MNRSPGHDGVNGFAAVIDGCTTSIKCCIFYETGVDDAHFIVAGYFLNDFTLEIISLLDQCVAGVNKDIAGRFRSGGADGQSKDRIGDGKGVLLTAYGNGIAVDGESFTFDGDGLVEVGGVTGKFVSAFRLIVSNGDGIKTGFVNV